MGITQSPQFIADMASEVNPDAPLKLYYFSFADGSRPKGTQFLGGLFIRAKSMSGALMASHRTGQNPGGEAQVFEFERDIDPKWVGRLLSRADLDAFDRETVPS